MWNRKKTGDSKIPLKKKALIVVCGPSGAGKSTMIREMLSLYGPKVMATTVSYTTRPPRGEEMEGCDYHFVSEEQFLVLKEKHFFAEWAYVYNYYYATAVEQIEGHWAEGKAIIKDIDLQGADQIKKLYPQAMRVFISPPSVEELALRMHKRKENSMEELEVRIGQAKKEMEQIAQFDHHLENVDLQETIKKLKKVIDEYLKTV